REYWADGSGTTKEVFVGGNILLGGGGSDLIEGRGGDDLIDGDAWLNVRISIVENRDGTGRQVHTVDGMKGAVTLQVNGQPVTKPLTQWMMEGVINPGQLKIVREILYDSSGRDTAVYWADSSDYDITSKGNGRLVIDHVNFDDAAVDPVTGKPRLSDGTDIVRNIEVLRFADGDIDIIKGTNGHDRTGSSRLDGDNGRDIIMGLLATMSCAEWAGTTACSVMKATTISRVVRATTCFTEAPAMTFSTEVPETTNSTATVATTPLSVARATTCLTAAPAMTTSTVGSATTN